MTSTRTADARKNGIDAPTGNQYLTFVLAGEEYGVEILNVQEVKAWENVTRIPNSPAYVKGVLDLRGAIVPIVDLRIRFGMPIQDYTPTTVILILKLEQSGYTQIIGIVVDAMSDVMDIPENQIKAPPDFTGHSNALFIRGLARLDRRLLILLDTEKLLSYEDINELTKQAEGEKAP